VSGDKFVTLSDCYCQICFGVVFKFDFRIYPDLIYNEDQPRRVDPGFNIIVPLAFVSSLMTSQNVSWIYLFHFQYNQCTLVQLLQRINNDFLIEIRKNCDISNLITKIDLKNELLKFF